MKGRQIRLAMAGVEGLRKANAFNAGFGEPAPEARWIYGCGLRELANLLRCL